MVFKEKVKHGETKWKQSREQKENNEKNTERRGREKKESRQYRVRKQNWTKVP